MKKWADGEANVTIDIIKKGKFKQIRECINPNTTAEEFEKFIRDINALHTSERQIVGYHFDFEPKGG